MGECTVSPSQEVVYHGGAWSLKKNFTLKNFNSLPDHQEDFWQHLLESDLNSLGEMGEGLMVPGCGWQRGQISPGDMVPSALTLKREFSLRKSQAGALTEGRGVGGAKNSETTQW